MININQIFILIIMVINSNEKITRRKISFLTYKTFYFIFLLFGPLLLSNLITFLFIIHFKRFKVLYERHLKFYK